MSEVLIEELKDLGLNSYEAKVYLALLERDSLSVSEISRLSLVPRARAYDILDTLLADGLAVLKPGRIKKYSAADPDSFGEKLTIQNENRYGHLKKKIDNVTLTLKGKFESAVNGKGINSDPLEYIEIIKDPYQVHKRFMDLVAQAREEILGFSKPPYSSDRSQGIEEMEQQADIGEKGIVKLKSIHEIPRTKEEIRERLENLLRTTKGSDETRVINELPMKMAIFDEKTIMLALKDPVSSATSFTTQIIEHSSLAKGLKILFNTLWEQAEDFHVLEDLLK